MEVRALLDALHIAERLKDETRHCYTSGGRREDVAEHSWRMALMAFWMKDEFPNVNIDKVIRMCLIHDLGECFTGDIPSFMKTASDEAKEDNALFSWVRTLPEPYADEMTALYDEMNALQTPEAKLYKCIDKLEAVIQHNESDISTWAPNEYQLNLTYAEQQVQYSEYLTKLRKAMQEDTLRKIEQAGGMPK
ncbi:MAG: HD domain-containing protein [Clostridia bacterium]|nr:HD domain-containing protein [Clostridia bacterium]